MDTQENIYQIILFLNVSSWILQMMRPKIKKDHGQQVMRPSSGLKEIRKVLFTLCKNWVKSPDEMLGLEIFKEPLSLR